MSGSRRGSSRPSPSVGSSPPDANTLGHPKQIERQPSSNHSGRSVGKVTPPRAEADDDADADGEPEPEADADVDLDAHPEVDALADAEAELLDAVEAAEANSSGSGSGWLKKEDS
jgi:hypothetical protein